MKPPPLLLGCALAFWGWQSDFPIPGIAMGLLVESARWIRARWEFSDQDFSRVWTFCSLLFLGAAVYAFNDNGGPISFGNWLQNPNVGTQAGAGLTTARTGATIFRWLPMIFFPFLAAQLFSTREIIPLATISLLVRRRQRKAQREGRPAPPSRNVDITWAYFIGTVLAAGVHPANNTSFFWGLAALLAWALWSRRSRRFGLIVWLATLGVGVLLGFGGQRGFGLLQRYLEGLNPEWLSRFMRRDVDPNQTRTALGQVGNLKTSGRIVIRVEPKGGSRVPVYLREASYRLYASSRVAMWLAGSSKNDTTGITEEAQNSGNWNVLSDQTNKHAIHIASYLNGHINASAAGLLPLPPGVVRFEKLPAYVLSYNSAGAVLAEGPHLVMFDALYNPAATLDSPPGTGSTNRVRGPAAAAPDGAESGRQPLPSAAATNSLTAKPAITNEDLHVPEVEVPALNQIIDVLKLRGLPRDIVLNKVAGFFAEQFTYRTWQPRGWLGTNETALSRFLLKSRAGHCEYFATASTLLLRQLGLPTRYAVGYVVHENSGSGYVVRLRDAHAWCLVWNPATKLWDDFETTPSSWIEEEKKQASVFQWLQDAWTRLGFEFAKFRWGQGNVRKYLLIGIAPGLAVLLYQIMFRRGRRRKPGTGGKPTEVFDWPGLDSEFYQLEKQLAARGVLRGASEPLREWLARVATTPGLTEICAPLQEIVRLHYRHRFDPLGLSAADREVLRGQVRACLDSLASAAAAMRGEADSAHRTSTR